MAIFSYKCPQCQKFSLIAPNGSCQQTLKKNKVCGYRIPFQYDLANHKYRSKSLKHSAPPEDRFSGTYSWVEGTSAYDTYNKETMTSGTVYLDLENKYLFLWHTPMGPSPIAHLMYSDATTPIQVSGVIAPLNSKIQNMHSFFSNSNDNWSKIAEGTDVVIEEPQPGHDFSYTVKKNEELVCEYNPFENSFWTGL